MQFGAQYFGNVNWLWGEKNETQKGCMVNKS